MLEFLFLVLGRLELFLKVTIFGREVTMLLVKQLELMGLGLREVVDMRFALAVEVGAQLPNRVAQRELALLNAREVSQPLALGLVGNLLLMIAHGRVASSRVVLAAIDLSRAHMAHEFKLIGVDDLLKGALVIEFHGRAYFFEGGVKGRPARAASRVASKS